jgi:hypothetical protein
MPGAEGNPGASAADRLVDASNALARRGITEGPCPPVAIGDSARNPLPSAKPSGIEAASEAAFRANSPKRDGPSRPAMCRKVAPACTSGQRAPLPSASVGSRHHVLGRLARLLPQTRLAMTQDTNGPGASTPSVDTPARPAGASQRRRAGGRVDTDAAAARHSGLTAETSTARVVGSEETAWDRIAELLIELALEHDPAILELVRPRAPTR